MQPEKPCVLCNSEVDAYSTGFIACSNCSGEWHYPVSFYDVDGFGEVEYNYDDYLQMVSDWDERDLRLFTREDD